MHLGANCYGKGEVRLVKVVRTPGRHELRDLTVHVALEGEFEAAHTVGDNTDLLATDTMRNTVYALAKQDLGLDRDVRAPARGPLRGGRAVGDACAGADRGAPVGPARLPRARVPARDRRHARVHGAKARA